MNRKKILIIVGTTIAVFVAIIVTLLTVNKKPTSYEILFETNGGSLIESQIVNSGGKINKPVDPIKEGYVFIEWIYQGKAYDFSLDVKTNLTLIARWSKLEEDIETYVVKFETDGGTTISNQIIEKGNKVSKPIDPIKDGYTFKGWILNDEFYNFDKIIEKDIELKAKWEKVKEVNNNTTNNNGSNNNSNITKPTTPTTPTVKKYTVTFNSNGGSSVASQTVTEGNKVSKPSNPTRSGYTFVGWTLNGSDYNFNSAVKGNITLVAKWNENEKIKYTVIFNSNGGSAVVSQTVTEGSKVSNPSAPTREGYNFGGWLLNGNIYDFNSSVNSNIILVAKWNQKTYSVVANKVDQISTGRTLSVFEDGNLINVQEFKYSDGSTICSGSNPNVDYYALVGESVVKIVLSNGTIVTANLTIN